MLKPDLKRFFFLSFYEISGMIVGIIWNPIIKMWFPRRKNVPIVPMLPPLRPLIDCTEYHVAWHILLCILTANRDDRNKWTVNDVKRKYVNPVKCLHMCINYYEFKFNTSAIFVLHSRYILILKKLKHLLWLVKLNTSWNMISCNVNQTGRGRELCDGNVPYDINQTSLTRN